MRNSKQIKLNILFWKSIGYRIISITIFISIFGFKFAIFTGLFSFFLYYIYDYLFNKYFRVVIDKGYVLWFTGLPCSGKTTLADAVAKGLKNRDIRVERLDGDIVRKGKLSDDLGFSKEDRDKNINRINFVSKLLSRQGVAVLASFVSPYQKTRNKIRSNVTNFIEIWVYASSEECARRDIKGMWAKAKAGIIKGFTGYDDPYEEPINPEIVCNTNKETINESVNKIINYLKYRKLI